jgi:hypothetical protein
MKILFHNYSNEVTTEPAYLTAALQRCGVDALLWSDPKVSTFDAFDSVQPDVFVTSYLTVTPDVLKYLERTSRKIDLVLNVTGVSDKQMEDIESVIKGKNLNVPFVFTNNFSHKKLPKTSIKCERIYPAFDLFAIRREQTQPLCKEALLCKSPSDLLNSVQKKKEVYHSVQITNAEKEESFDLRCNALSMHELFKYYQKWTLIGDTDFCSSQLFFDLNMNVNNVSVSVEDEENFNKFLREIFNDAGDIEDMGKQIKGQLKDRHTPFHRAGTLCKHLKHEDGLSQVEQVKGQLSEFLKEL